MTRTEQFNKTQLEQVCKLVIIEGFFFIPFFMNTESFGKKMAICA